MSSAPRLPDASQAAADAAAVSSAVPGSAGLSDGLITGRSPAGTGLNATGASATGAISSATLAPRKSGYEKFESHELAIVLSHFDIGIIIKTDRGAYLLKRRARGKDDAFKVAFCHQLQMYLASKQFPLPHLIGTKNENNSMLQLDDQIYELFEYIKGVGYDSSLEQTGDSGKIQAIFHKLLQEFQSEYLPPAGSYHGSRYVTGSLDKIPATLLRVYPEAAAHAEATAQNVQFLHAAYASAMVRLNDMGMLDWPSQIVHSDWHPGNMLFRGPRVVAVIDYDAARIQQRIIDIANGALQFSILGGGDDPMQWPPQLDEARFQRFVRAYDEVPGCQLARAELRAIPWLMVEALIAEAAIPIAATGQFARMPGYYFLSMVERKVRWLQSNAEKLAGVLES
jgi:homoserine kinase type II